MSWASKAPGISVLGKGMKPHQRRATLIRPESKAKVEQAASSLLDLFILSTCREVVLAR